MMAAAKRSARRVIFTAPWWRKFSRSAALTPPASAEWTLDRYAPGGRRDSRASLTPRSRRAAFGFNKVAARLGKISKYTVAPARTYLSGCMSDSFRDA